MSPSADSSSKSADQVKPAACVGVGGPHVAQRGDVDPHRLGLRHLDRVARGSAGSAVVSPTWTGTDTIALMPSGSSTEVPVVTSKTTAPGPAYAAAAETRKRAVAGDRRLDLGARARPTSGSSG